MKNSAIVKLESMDNAVLFVKICNKYKDVNIDYSVIGSRYIVDAKSVMGIMSTTLGREANVTIHTDNSRVIDSFVDHIHKWIVGYF